MENQMITGKLVKKIQVQGFIKALTGLHIGGSNLGMSIGGADATVVRNPLTNEPYIPGSSLKGKMRALLERVHVGEQYAENFSKVPNFVENFVFHDIRHPIVQLFGTTPEEVRKRDLADQPVGRLIVRDCLLTRKSAQRLFGSKTTDMPYTEVKTEVAIDRVTSAAVPRQLERVPAGAVFRMEHIINVYEGDDESRLLNLLFEGLLLLQNDYLGGKGSRGSGQVRIVVGRLRYKDRSIYEERGDWQPYEAVTIPQELQVRSRTVS
ncbi:type III-A CRISPR-associated RAMP protein Csm3 [Rhodothermus marinus]|uniref:CRISPR system Cms endoribonuclease Csm3 n=1 Tax=Rhodothermus marinus (strain ATCC 43812 / DSM 4252 / R-10) TaxID=518766 RepID=D0MJ63_RHOM4|nr:type III-A CRISPR-associated RAMP protein Csm3 [Rhodothermus marinus]ACY48521.1 CRISPR-associated RAMP protein, Csm3 family [Rhodothermus marinus DSM 4252]